MKAIEVGAIFLEEATATKFRNFEHSKREGEKEISSSKGELQHLPCPSGVVLHSYNDQEKLVIQPVNGEKDSLSIATRRTQL